MYSRPIVRVIDELSTRTGRGNVPDWRIQRLEKTLLASRSPATLQKLSADFGLSARHVGRRFKQTTGIGFRAYTFRIRLHRALDLLRSSDLSVKEISGVLGYNHASDFCHQFKQACDLTPSHFRCCVRILDAEVRTR